MVMPQMELMVDALLALLLIGVMGACFVVNRRLNEVRRGQDEMNQVVDSLNRAVQEAQSGIKILRATADEVEANLSAEVKKGRALADELTLITQAGNNLADRIEGGLTSARSEDGRARETVASFSGQGSKSTTEVGSSGEKAPAVTAEKQRKLMSALKEAR